MSHLADDDARRIAIASHHRSYLVEAGAGSGKTAVMAGRIALLLAAGVAPRHIAAVTFTELAASELVTRVRDFVAELLAGQIPTELRIALPSGLSTSQAAHLRSAEASLDAMACSTIHSLCQRLIAPYPVEANIDPGARVMDRDQADIAFADLRDRWLRQALDSDDGGLLAPLVMADPKATVELICTVLDKLRTNPALTVTEAGAVAPALSAFTTATASLTAFVTAAQEDDTITIARLFADLAETLPPVERADSPEALVGLLLTSPPADLLTQAGSFKAYKKKGKWLEVAKRAGLSKAEGERFNADAEGLYTECCQAWGHLQQTAASRVLADLVTRLREVVEGFRAYKRSAALLDFDDLIHAARDLLRDHDAVRRALAARYTHVLVDEFQDTDPLQTEIFWRLCGDPPAEGDADWRRFNIRPGALFLVGDPKQAIYRFRGADVAAYLDARTRFHHEAPDSILSISTNFRSRRPILDYVNQRFAGPLSVEQGQPGFTPLNAILEGSGHPGVAALEVTSEDDQTGKDQQRDSEAEAVAAFCARLIGSWPVADRKSGRSRPCRPGDIALLAPSGTELWRYEAALERCGIPVATQAGKGFYRRQEVQDLIALTRILADPRDTLALAALLRGPVVGLSDEELLDLVWDKPALAASAAPAALPRLTLELETRAIRHPHARDLLEKLQSLRRRVHATTPHELLSQAVDVLRLKAVLVLRHRGQADRALANVDLYLSQSRAFAVRGLRAFAETMSQAWSDETRAMEGRPDAQEEAVALYTMHAAKGLEWPVVIPINTMTAVTHPDAAVVDRAGGRLSCPVFKVKPAGYDAAREAEKTEFERERIRLWYVAATRARELLVLPRPSAEPRRGTWSSLLDLALSSLPVMELADLPARPLKGSSAAANRQSRDGFAAEAATIAAGHRSLVWLAPSRGEDSGVDAAETPVGFESDEGTLVAIPEVRGGRERGLILHKLMEEVLTGEVGDGADDLRRRATTLIAAFGRPECDDPARGLSAGELADCVGRTLALPEIAALRPRLVAEVSVYAATPDEAGEQVAAGVVDALAVGPNGTPEVVIDWKSDVAITPEALAQYCGQVRAYLRITGAQRGLIVLMSSRTVVTVTQ